MNKRAAKPAESGIQGGVRFYNPYDDREAVVSRTTPRTPDGRIVFLNESGRYSHVRLDTLQQYWLRGTRAEHKAAYDAEQARRRARAKAKRTMR